MSNGFLLSAAPILKAAPSYNDLFWPDSSLCALLKLEFKRSDGNICSCRLHNVILSVDLLHQELEGCLHNEGTTKLHRDHSYCSHANI